MSFRYSKVCLGLMNIIVRFGSQEQSGKDRMGRKQGLKQRGASNIPGAGVLSGVRYPGKAVQ